MRKLLVVALTLAFTAVAASAAGAPPVIAEPFTPLACPAKPVTTLAREGCAEHRLLASDRKIDKRARAIFLLLRRRSREAVSRFVRGERAWLGARRAVCRSRSDVYEGGSEAPVAFLQCELRANASHLVGLKLFERQLQRS